MPLWPDPETPLASEWQAVRAAWSAAGPGWQFWTRWYDAALQGRPLLGDWDRHWALLTDIALIENDLWDAAPDVVNERIIEIVQTHRTLAAVIDKTPNGEIIALDPATGALMSVPVPGIDGDLRDHILRSVEKAVERFRAACGGTSPLDNFGPTLMKCAEQDLTYLLEDIRDHKDFDLALHDDIETLLWSLRRKFAEQGLSNDAAAASLMGVLDRCTVDIYASSAPAREALEKRGEEYYRRISLEHHLELNQLAQDMAADSVEALRQQMLNDLSRADDETADPGLRRLSRSRTIGRLPRGAEAIRYSRYVDGERIVDDRPQPADKNLWWATVLGPIGAALLSAWIGK